MHGTTIKITELACYVLNYIKHIVKRVCSRYEIKFVLSHI